MTPVAQRLAEQFSLPPRLREDLFDPDKRLRCMPDAHCFELSAVHELAEDLASSLTEHRVVQARLAFLPAPVTILEWFKADERRSPFGGHFAYMLVQSRQGDVAHIYSLTAGSLDLDDVCFTPIGDLPLAGGAEIGGIANSEPPERIREEAGKREVTGRLLYAHMEARLYARLALINTPRIIGRRQHMPEAWLQKRVARGMGMASGKFPLHAWTEIKLEVTAPRDLGGDPPRETHLTGGKALHFCRAHLRIQNGMVVLVRAHWRGDPALGIKQSRYAVVPPRSVRA